MATDTKDKFWLRVSKWYVGVAVVFVLSIAVAAGYGIYSINQVVSNHNSDIKTTHSLVVKVTQDDAKIKALQHQILTEGQDIEGYAQHLTDTVNANHLQGVENQKAICVATPGCDVNKITP